MEKKCSQGLPTIHQVKITAIHIPEAGRCKTFHSPI